MLTDTEAIVLRQVKTMSSRRMLVLFSKKYGKISVGTGITEGGKNKSALIIKPFTYGRYELFKGKETYNLNSGQVIKSFYDLGSDFDKYMAASYILELTEKILPEEIEQPRLFQTLKEFLEALEVRKQKVETLTVAYMVKALDMLGVMPQITRCANCMNPDAGKFFSIRSGGMVCEKCAKRMSDDTNKDYRRELIYDADFDIVGILSYFKNEPFKAFEKIALDDSIASKLKEMLKEYMEYHLDIGKLKSEMLISGF